MANARQRGSDLRIRSEAKAAAADKLLLAAQIERETYDTWTTELNETPRWRWRRRRKIQAQRFDCLWRFMGAITSAQHIAKKGRYV